VANRISIILDVAADKANSTLKRFRGEVDSADKQVKKTSGGIKGAMSTIANATVAGFGVGQVVDFVGNILTAGTAMEAMDAKAETVFGRSLPRVEKWGETNAKAMGLTTREATAAAASMADLLKPMGFTEEAATDQSLALLDLSGALSAWSGGQRSAADVSQILTKAMLGEREELKSLGISITEADVQSRLAAKGQKQLTGAALAQAKAVATQELIYEKSTDAQKAWSDGSMDGVKAQNEAQSSLAKLQEVMTESLYPALVDLVPVLADTATQVTAIAGPALKLVKVAQDLGVKFGGVDIVTQNLEQSLFDMAPAIEQAGLNFDKTFLAVSNGEMSMEELNNKLRINVDITDKAANRSDYYSGVVEDLGVTLHDVSKDQRDDTDAKIDAERATRDLEKATRDMDAAYAKLKGNLDQRQAWRNLQDSLSDLQDEINSGEASWADLSEATDDAVSSAADYISTAEDIPTEVKTQLYAQLDQGDLDAVLLFIEGLQRGVDLPVRPKVVGQGASLVALQGGAIPKFDEGGVMPGPKGQHSLALVAGGETVLPTHKGGGSVGGGQVIMNVTINTAADPKAVTDALVKQARQNGGADIRRALGL
jgi:hypothetical protein